MTSMKSRWWSVLYRRAWWSSLATYLGGCLAFSVGADFFIIAEAGTDPLDVLVLGLQKHVPITIGIGQAAVALICIAVWAAWNRRRPIISPFITFFLCGSIIDILLLTRFAEATQLPNVVLLLLAGVLCAYGSSLIIMSGIGIRAMDLLALTMREKWRWPFWCAKGSLEAALLVSGYFLGGPVGIGTIYFLASVDLLIQPFIRVNERYVGIPNLGLKPLPAR